MYLQTADVLALSTASNERMRILENGQVIINNSGVPLSMDRFTVQGVDTEYAINGYTTNSTGVYGENSSGAGYGVFGNSSNVGVRGIGAHGGVLESTLPNGFGTISSNSNADGTGLLATGNNENGVYLVSGSGIAASGTKAGIYAYAGNGNTGNANRGNSAGVFELDTDNDITTGGNNDFRAIARLAGYDNLDPSDPPTNEKNSYYGGYFSGGNQSGTPTYAFVGIRYWSNGNGHSTTNTIDYKIIGTGSVSTLVKDNNNKTRVLFAPETPEILFMDYGIGQLVNGLARITLDPILKAAIHVDAKSPLKVFVTLEGDCNGVFVTSKSADGFTVKELQNGTSSVSFSWQIVATRANTKDINGKIISNSVGVRFPEGPIPLQPSSLKKVDKQIQLKTAEALKVNKQKT